MLINKKILFETLDRVAKWRAIFASWQLGTRTDTDGECLAVRDHREATMMLRIEMDALVTLLINKKVITEDDLVRRATDAAFAFEAGCEERFPGAKATADGMKIDVERFAKTAKELHFPP